MSKFKIIIFITFLIISIYIVSINNYITHNFEKYFTKRYQYQKKEYSTFIRINHNNSFYKIYYNNSFKTKVVICAIAKQENLYIKEFVEYYRNLGIKKIFLYDNNELNGEKFEEVLSDHINGGFVEINNYRGKLSPQREAYTDCYINNNNKFDWFAFYDIIYSQNKIII